MSSLVSNNWSPITFWLICFLLLNTKKSNVSLPKKMCYSFKFNLHSTICRKLLLRDISLWKAERGTPSYSENIKRHDDNTQEISNNKTEVQKATKPCFCSSCTHFFARENESCEGKTLGLATERKKSVLQQKINYFPKLNNKKKKTACETQNSHIFSEG